MATLNKRKLIPLVLPIGIIALDQISKALIVSASSDRIMVIKRFFGDFLFIVHQRNLGAAFSLADGLPPLARFLVLALLPLIVLAAVLVFYFRSKELSRLQEWALMGIIGGGIGNVIDRILREKGVVDFISVKFYGIFGFERWPTFNVADSAVVVCSIIIAVSFIIQGIGDMAKAKSLNADKGPKA